jgi:hypothetical protein
MTRLMRDSTDLKDIPVHGTDLVAGYINGAWVASEKDFARFPGIPHVHIDVFGDGADEAGVLDYEALNPRTAEGCTEWAKRRNKLHPGYPAVIYCDRSHLTPLFNAMNAAGLRIVKDFRLWIATLDGTKKVPDMTGVTAVQFAGAKMTGGHYDESIVYDDTWHPSHVTHG